MAGGYDHRKKAAEAEEKTRESKPKIHHIEVHPAMGEHSHRVERHFHPNDDGSFPTPKSKSFSLDRGPQALAHIAKHAGIAARVEGGESSPGEEAAETPQEEAAEQAAGGEEAEE